MTLTPQQIALRLIAAAFLASLVGLDRERRESPAGLRTHALVGMSSCLFMIVSAFGFADILGTPNVTLDPSRIAAQVVTGIGFLGAGTIIAHGSLVRGLTTAASVWSVAAIGMAAGAGLYFPAFLATALVLLFLTFLRPLERRLDKQWRKHSIEAVYNPGQASLEQILAVLSAQNLHVTQISVRKDEESNQREVQLSFEESGDSVLQKAVQTITAVPGVERASTN